MKNLFKTSLIAVTIAACSTAVFFTACKKENNKLSTNTEKSTSKQSEQDKQTELKIRAFRSQVQSNARITENLSTEEALWYMEAALNYTFCRGSQGILMPEVDTTEITLTETSSGVVAFAEVAEKYNILAALMETNAAALAQNNRQYMVVDLTDLGNNNGTITFRVMIMNGEIDASTGGNARVTENPFGPTDNYKYGYKLGKCDGTQAGKTDAAIQLTDKINRTYKPVEQPCYFTDVEETFIDDPTFFRTPNDVLDNINDYLIFYRAQETVNFDECIPYAPADQMNFCYNGLLSIKTNLDAQYLPANKVMKSVYVEGFKYTKPSTTLLRYIHKVKYFYGVKHLGEIPD